MVNVVVYVDRRGSGIGHHASNVNAIRFKAWSVTGLGHLDHGYCWLKVTRMMLLFQACRVVAVCVRMFHIVQSPPFTPPAFSLFQHHSL